jgi:hypothetical protein
VKAKPERNRKSPEGIRGILFALRLTIEELFLGCVSGKEIFVKSCG